MSFLIVTSFKKQKKMKIIMYIMSIDIIHKKKLKERGQTNFFFKRFSRAMRRCRGRKPVGVSGVVYYGRWYWVPRMVTGTRAS